MPRYIRPYKLFVGAFVPNWLLERTEISAGAKLCFARLAQYEGAEGEARPGQQTLARELGVGERMVRNYIQELERAGLIEVEQVGLNKVNRYKFLEHAWMGFGDEPAEGISGQDRKDASGPDRNDVAGPERKDSSGPSNEENQRRETGADAPESPSDDPSLFQAPGLPEGSPGSHGSPSPHGGGPPPPSVSQNRYSRKKTGTAEDVQRVHEAFQRGTDSPRAKLTDARRRKITARLREGYTPEQLITVVTDGWRADPWTGRVDNNDLVILLRDGPQVEKFLKLAAKAKVTTNGNGRHAADEEAVLREAREFNARQEARRRAATTTPRGRQLAAELAARKGASQQ